jgi:L-alanine-DL-glutamate epimerase-like enolase superfamily enzyme
MIIDRIEPIALRLPNHRPGAPDAVYAVLCRVTVRSGLVGYGECLCLLPTQQGSLMAALRDAVAPLYLGQSSEDRERLNREARIRLASFGRAGTNINALAAVDTALWDIAGKAAGRSLSSYLGGTRRTRVPVMANLSPYNDVGKLSARLAQALESAPSAVKVHEFDVALVEAARKIAGPTIPFVADCNNAHTLAEVQKNLARWQALDMLWFEDPVWPPEVFLEPTGLPGVVVGLGADLGSAEQLALYGRSPSVGVVQPDLAMLGGVSETRRAMSLLEAHGVTIAPHTPFIGPGALASLHFMATMKGTAYYTMVEVEPHMDMYGGSGVTRWQQDLGVPTGPGLGLDPDPAYLEKYALNP